MNKRTNLLFFVADQMRRDTLAHLGSPGAKTPNFDALAAEGVSFENAYCQNPVCVPSRCSFLTGWYPHTRGHRTMHFLLHEDEPMLMKTLKEEGYEVVWLGKNEVLPIDTDLTPYCDERFPEKYIWDREKSAAFEKTFRGEPDGDNFYSFYAGKTGQDQADGDRASLDYAMDYLEHRQGKSGKPFALFLFMNFPHPPYGCEEPWFSLIDRQAVAPRRPTPESWEAMPAMLEGIHAKQQLQGWSEERWRELKAVYYGMVSQLDSQFGELSDKLKALGLYDNTNIFMFSDHGDYTGDYGIVEKAQNCFHNSICNIPLIVKPAADVAVQPRVTKALAELVDLCATVADLAGFELEYTQFGKSLRPVLEGADEHKDTVFAEGGRIHGEWQAKEQGHGSESIYWPRLSTQCEDGPAHGKTVMARERQFKYIHRLYENGELYDLENDPNELVNLFGQEEYAPVVAQMEKRVLRYLLETGDFVPNKKDRGY